MSILSLRRLLPTTRMQCRTCGAWLSPLERPLPFVRACVLHMDDAFARSPRPHGSSELEPASSPMASSAAISRTRRKVAS